MNKKVKIIMKYQDSRNTILFEMITGNYVFLIFNEDFRNYKKYLPCMENWKTGKQIFKKLK